MWNPINEPLVVTISGYVNIAPILAGNFPPGIGSFPATIAVLRNLRDGNRRAYDEIHRWDRRASVGLVQNMIAFTPADPASERDVRATEHANYLFNRLFIDAAVDQKVPNGSANANIDRFLLEARDGKKFESDSYMLTDVLEYFAQMAVIYLRGEGGRERFYTPAIKEKRAGVLSMAGEGIRPSISFKVKAKGRPGTQGGF